MSSISSTLKNIRDKAACSKAEWDERRAAVELAEDAHEDVFAKVQKERRNGGEA